MPVSNSNLLSMASEFSGLPMDSLIGGPLNAAANANASMAMTQTKFMLDTCFTKTADPKTKKDNYSPIMIVMSLSRGVITPGTPAIVDSDGKTVLTPAKPAAIDTITTAFNLPLLTIIPLNSLAVQTVEIGFEMEVKSSYSEEQTDEKSKSLKVATEFEAKFAAGPFSVSVKGSASYDSSEKSTNTSHYQKSNSAKYTVKVTAGQLPLPKGVNVIIEAFAGAIQPVQVPTEQAQQVKAAA